MRLSSLPNEVWVNQKESGTVSMFVDPAQLSYVPIWRTPEPILAWAASTRVAARPFLVITCDFVQKMIVEKQSVDYLLINPTFAGTGPKVVNGPSQFDTSHRLSLHSFADVREAYFAALDALALEESSDLLLRFIADRYPNWSPRHVLHDTDNWVAKIYTSKSDLHDFKVARGEKGPDGAYAWRFLRPNRGCQSCNERVWKFESLSPNKVAAQWTCRYCKKQVIIRNGDDTTQVHGTRHISKSVQREVWQRDRGRCVVCESQIALEFDHIIPVSLGGASTVRNVQLLCEKCNRSKSGKPPG